MGLYLRTRGSSRALDYHFLGEAPGIAWWRAYHELTDLERPTILLESDGRSWRSYMSGFGSRRHDVTGAPASFDLVMTGDCDPADQDDQNLALTVILTSIEDLAKQPLGPIPGTRLDAQFSDDEIDLLLSSPGRETLARAATALRRAYAGLPAGTGRAADPTLRRWLGGLGHAGSRTQFAAMAGRLLAGQPGSALMLNLLSAEAEARIITERDKDIGLLVSRPGQFFAAAPSRLPGRGLSPHHAWPSQLRRLLRLAVRKT